MTHKMQVEAEAARALVQLEVAVRVAIRNSDEAAVQANYVAYAKAGGCYTLDEIEDQEKKTMRRGKKS